MLKIVVEIPDFGLSIKNKLQRWKKAMTVYICKTPNKYLLLEYNFDKRTNIGNCSNIFCTCQVSNSANASVTM